MVKSMKELHSKLYSKLENSCKTLLDFSGKLDTLCTLVKLSSKMISRILHTIVLSAVNSLIHATPNGMDIIETTKFMAYQKTAHNMMISTNQW